MEQAAMRCLLVTSGSGAQFHSDMINEDERQQMITLNIMTKRFESNFKSKFGTISAQTRHMSRWPGSPVGQPEVLIRSQSTPSLASPLDHNYHGTYTPHLGGNELTTGQKALRRTPLAGPQEYVSNFR